ncbi:MFS transporter [uncultured Pseudokineococcus sp.]|uniref:MFS transporter n=1 Tax=uncultured Pseudokineococcus sp. TaxID=1642928 RepID=UPI002619EE01|nr:MFS transporter [uncultured Pseudokineococcus sp.]
MVKRTLQTGTAVGVGVAERTPRGLVAAGAGLIALTYGVVRFGYGLHLPQLAAEFSLSPQLAGGIASGSFAAYCATALVARGAGERLGGRAVLWLAAAVAAAGALVVATAGSAAVLATGVLVAGGAAGAASPALVVAVAATVPQRAAARAQALVNGGTGLGVAVAGAAVLAWPSTWRPVWASAAVAALVLAAVVDRRARWPDRAAREREAAGGGAGSGSGAGAELVRPVLAAVLAGVGSAAVWTFGRDLLAGEGGLPERTTAALWVALGAAAVLGGLSGDAVRVVGLRGAWAGTAALSAAGTAVLALAPGHVLLAGTAGALFGGAYTALSGVLIAWAAALRPHAAGATTATLFVALTAGQAVGATTTGALAARTGAPASFLLSAGLLLLAAAVLPRHPGRDGAPRRRRTPSATA